ncbi:hypothetical protein [Flavobacterium sp.]|uniref:hypothetical protein n=1 Tax=Flavobacterium sp. TaxID=239 RepID=UPI001B5D9849|nr:hypothetical protein [Flavobacterium sp.]MBP6127481.1 hypothetical protein [Flavobacterium sp.]
MKLRNAPTGKGKTIKPQHLNKIFIDCDTQNLLNDFENKNIQNDLLNSWRVVYYFNVLNSVLTFTIDEYDFIHQSLKSFIRNKKIDEVLKKNIN